MHIKKVFVLSIFEHGSLSKSLSKLSRLSEIFLKTFRTNIQLQISEGRQLLFLDAGL